MEKMKRLLALVMIMASVAGLSACGGSKDAQTDDAQGGDDGDAAEKIVIQVGYGNNPGPGDAEVAGTACGAQQRHHGAGTLPLQPAGFSG